MTGTDHQRIASLLGQAIAAHQAGNLPGAEQAYDAVLAADPDNADALNLKGVALADQGRAKEAIALFERASALLPGFPDVHFNKANAFAGTGQIAEALNSYATAIALRPAFADARINAGALLMNAGRHEEAVAAFREMTRACPSDPRAYLNLGVCLQKSWTAHSMTRDSATEALAALQHALSLRPADAEVHWSLGALYSRLGAYDDAVNHLRAMIDHPALPVSKRAEALSTIGEIRRKQGRHADAVAAQRAAFALQPENRDIRYNLATAIQESGDHDEAESHYLSLIAQYPGFVRPYINLGNIYRERNRIDEAGALFEKALSVEPNFAAAYANLGALCVNQGWFVTGLLLHDKAKALGVDDPSSRFQRATTLLNLGRLSDGWAGYDERHDAPEEGVIRHPEPPEYWQGQDLSGKRLLIWTEQGLGDEILHGSVIPDVLKRAGHCVIECSRRMAPIFARSFPQAEVIGVASRLHTTSPPEDFDYQISIASLARYFRPDFASFPRHAGYLKANAARTDILRRDYVRRAGGRKIVGISWRSRNDRLGPDKSGKLLNLAALLQTPDVMFVNLQYGDCSAELTDVRERLGIEIFQDATVDSVADVDAFFSQVAAMDLVITTSNTTAHVAGAQNVPVWILLPLTKGTIWYWFHRRQDSPWYPSARLIRATKFRSSEPWESETAVRAAADLREYLRA